MLEFVDSVYILFKIKINFINPLLQVGSGSGSRSGGPKINGCVNDVDPVGPEISGSEYGKENPGSIVQAGSSIYHLQIAFISKITPLFHCSIVKFAYLNACFDISKINTISERKKCN